MAPELDALLDFQRIAEPLLQRRPPFLDIALIYSAQTNTLIAGRMTIAATGQQEPECHHMGRSWVYTATIQFRSMEWLLDTIGSGILTHRTFRRIPNPISFKPLWEGKPSWQQSTPARFDPQLSAPTLRAYGQMGRAFKTIPECHAFQQEVRASEFFSSEALRKQLGLYAVPDNYESHAAFPVEFELPLSILNATATSTTLECKILYADLVDEEKLRILVQWDNTQKASAAIRHSVEGDGSRSIAVYRATYPGADSYVSVRLLYGGIVLDERRVDVKRPPGPEPKAVPSGRDERPPRRAKRADGPLERWDRKGNLKGGGQAEVILVLNKKNGTQGVLKRVSATRSSDEKAKIRLRREIRILLDLQDIAHPGIARLVDSSSPDADEPWLVTEFVPLKSLHDQVDRFRGNVGRTAGLLMELADVLDAVHGQDIVHRDVKPKNILIHSYQRPVLIDFGIAHDGKRTSITSEFERVGSAGFSPPEANDGHILPSPAFDVFSVGKIFYFLISGGANFETQGGHRDGGRDLVSVMGDARYEAINAFLDRVCAWLVLERPQTARELSALIEETVVRFDRSFVGNRPSLYARSPMEVLSVSELGDFDVKSELIDSTGSPIEPSIWRITVEPIKAYEVPRNELIRACEEAAMEVTDGKRGQLRFPLALAGDKQLRADGVWWRRELVTGSEKHEEQIVLSYDGRLDFQRALFRDEGSRLHGFKFSQLGFDAIVAVLFAGRLKRNLPGVSELKARLSLRIAKSPEVVIARFDVGGITSTQATTAAIASIRDVNGRVNIATPLLGGADVAGIVRLINYAAAAFVHEDDGKTLMVVDPKSVEVMVGRLEPPTSLSALMMPRRSPKSDRS